MNLSLDTSCEEMKVWRLRGLQSQMKRSMKLSGMKLCRVQHVGKTQTSKHNQLAIAVECMFAAATGRMNGHSSCFFDSNYSNRKGCSRTCIILHISQTERSHRMACFILSRLSPAWAIRAPSLCSGAGELFFSIMQTLP